MAQLNGVINRIVLFLQFVNYLCTCVPAIRVTSAEVPVPRYQCRGTSAEVPVSRYQCRGTSAEVPVPRYDKIFENVEIIHFIVNFDYVSTSMGWIKSSVSSVTIILVLVITFTFKAT